MSAAFDAAHDLNRGILFGPLIGKVQLHLKVMSLVQYIAHEHAPSNRRQRCSWQGKKRRGLYLAPLLQICR